MEVNNYLPTTEDIKEHNYISEDDRWNERVQIDAIQNLRHTNHWISEFSNQF